MLFFFILPCGVGVSDWTFYNFNLSSYEFYWVQKRGWVALKSRDIPSGFDLKQAETAGIEGRKREREKKIVDFFMDGSRNAIYCSGPLISLPQSTSSM